MLEMIDSDPNHDPKLSEISFSDKDGVFTMEIVAKNKIEAAALKGRLVGLRGIYEMDSPTYQNFQIEYPENNEIIKIKGNIFNAFTILKESKLISNNFSTSIERNDKVTQCLVRSKAFVLPENQDIPAKIVTPNPLESISSLQQSYVDALAKLNPSQLESALNSLANSLSSKGTSVEIKVQSAQNKSQLAV